MKLQQKKLFGKSSEKISSEQISLFDEVEVESTPINDETQVVIQEHKRSKKKHHSTDHLKKTTIEYTLSGEELICPTCDHELHAMSKTSRQELIFIPSKVEIIEHVEHIYSCRHCETTDIEATIIKAEGPKPLIKGSKASASLIANIINDKYDKALPLYRQEVEDIMRDLGIVEEDEIVNVPGNMEKMARCKLVLDEDKVIELDIEDYLSGEDVIKETDYNGMTKITIKNIRDIVIK